MVCQIIPFPQELRPQLPTIVGNVDYLTLRQRLEQIDVLLRRGGVERDFVQRALASWKRAASGEPTAREQEKFQQRSRRALRCMILRTLLQEDYRGFSCQLAGNPLYQWFCLIDALDQVRGKAGAEVEFGNTVLIGENRQGLILDYELFRESAPADSQLLFGSLLRVWEATGRHVGAVVTDRGFASASNSRTLKQGGTFDGLCPRQPAELSRRMKGKTFARLQRRRAQTEGRIGILKQGFLGRPMRAKGFDHRELALAWGVLTHNLWMLARMRKTAKQSRRLQKAA